ncbi:MAG: Polyribonucleotide nucleotidyltransferase, partial [Actinomycetia bacterium]|nr:Polyribonucleotide nucleotidyltransferase [Actinomycetes bacterium]
PQLEQATFDMVVAGRMLPATDELPDGDVAIMMVEAESTPQTLRLLADAEATGAVAPDEETVAEGLEAAKPFIAALCQAQTILAAAAVEAGLAPATTSEFPIFADYGDDVFEAVSGAVTDELAKALTIAPKQERAAEEDRVKALAQERLAEKFEGREKEISAAIRSLTKKRVRQRVVNDGLRIDGRGLTDIRPLSSEVGVLPRVHGSALFERGETQILGVTTLNMLRMEQMVDTLNPERTKRYMHNYNMPPYSTGETGRVGSPKRREIGHGALAERAIVPVLPTREEFPYAIRQVSEALGSNGSTSMGSVCASTMALLNAGVPLKGMVSGIAMGLIYEGGSYVTLTDILGAEDAFGDMDFKVAGTEQVITALQLDTKLDGIPASVLGAALKQARGARMTILGVMRDAVSAPGEMSPFAPRIITIKVPVDKIGEVIGPKGKMINSIQDDTGAEITIEDDGTIYIGATDGPSADAARDVINAIANPHMPEVGERFLGTVVKTTTFGAFVSLLPGKDGLLHVTQIRKLHGGRRIENVDEVIHIGDKIQVEIREIDDRGKLSLVPVEVIEREAAGEDLGGGESNDDRPGIRSERSERDRPHRERSGGEGGGDRRPRQRSRGGQRD